MSAQSQRRPRQRPQRDLHRSPTFILESGPGRNGLFGDGVLHTSTVVQRIYPNAAPDQSAPGLRHDTSPEHGPAAGEQTAGRVVTRALPAELGKLAVFFSTQGGTGATTLACNAAATLARANCPVCVVDLDLQLGNVLTLYGLEPRCPMSKLARDMESFDWEMVGPMLSRHVSGVSVVSQVGHLEEVNELTPGRIPQLLRYLQEHFKVVIVDGVRDFSDHALAAMDVADQLVLVLTQDVPAIHGAARRLAIFRKLGYPSSKTRLVVNRHDKKSKISIKAIGEAVGMAPDLTVCNDYTTVSQAIIAGQTLHQTNAGATVSQDMDRLARALFDLPSRTRRRAGLWRRVFKKG